MNHAAFLEAILAEPDEPVHRLVYADWLEEHGEQARAEFIRLQLQRTQLPVWSLAARRILRREQELLQSHEQQWIGDLPRFVQRWRFHGGFIEEISLVCDQFLSEGKQLYRHWPIRRLHLRNSRQLPALLDNEPARQVMAELLAPIIYLDFNREYLDELAGLKLLHLPQLPRLRGLNLWTNALSTAGLEILGQSEVMESLESLEIRSSVGSTEVLLSSYRLGKLRQLILGCDSRLVTWLSRCPLLAQLESLSFVHGTLRTDDLEMLLHSPLAAGLLELDLSCTQLNPSALRRLASGGVLGKLRWLNLSLSLRSTGIELLAGSAMLSRLEGLDVSLNRLGESGGLALARHVGPCRLQTLDLLYNDLSERARAALVERFGQEVCLFTA